MTASSQPRLVKCPTCEKSVAWTAEQPFRPFCSERCRLLDLGEWVAGEKVISEPAISDPSTELEFWQ